MVAPLHHIRHTTRMRDTRMRDTRTQDTVTSTVGILHLHTGTPLRRTTHPPVTVTSTEGTLRLMTRTQEAGTNTATTREMAPARTALAIQYLAARPVLAAIHKIATAAARAHPTTPVAGLWTTREVALVVARSRLAAAKVLAPKATFPDKRRPPTLYASLRILRLKQQTTTAKLQRVSRAVARSEERRV